MSGRALNVVLCSSWMTCLVAISACGARPSPSLAARLRFVSGPTEERRVLAELTLINDGEATLERDWRLYFNAPRRVEADSMPPSLTLTWINGDFYRLEPSGAFEPLEPGRERAIRFEMSGSAVNIAAAPAGLYWVELDGAGNESTPRRIELSDVTLPASVATRGPRDQLPLSTPELRFRRDESLTLLPREKLPPVLPTPSRWQREEGRVQLEGGQLSYPPELEAEARYLEAALGRADVAVTLSLSPDLAPRETYRLTAVDRDGVSIVGSDAAGVFYGIQSLRSLLPSRGPLRVDAVTIEDSPRFPYRGMHLDVARNFRSVATVEKLLELMAVYKLNRFHFHLTDDEGWRIEIRGLPELTSVGGRRGHTVDERAYLIPALGSGPDPDVSSGSGHYSREEFVELLRFAHERHIEVVPEVDVPGHARAAIKAMEARYRRLADAGDEVAAREFLLTDFEDRSRYRSIQGYTDNVVNVCLESTYRFVETVVDDIASMYREAGLELRVLHVGGDEVPAGVWGLSPACEGREDLTPYFLDRVDEILRRRNVTLAGWEEIASSAGEDMDSPMTPNPKYAGRFQVNPWSSIWGRGGTDTPYRLANAGYDVVLSGASNLYFDLAYEKDPLERGLFWAGFVDTRKPWELVPLALWRTTDRDVMGAPLEPSPFTVLTDEGRRHVLGLQGHLWGELLNDAERAEYMAFPKLLGLAERAWAEAPEWGEHDGAPGREADWNIFANMLGQRELPRLDRMLGGVAYRLPPPGAVVEDGVLRANVAFPGLDIRYTTDGSEPSASSPRYDGPLNIDTATASLKLRTFDTRGRGSCVSEPPL